MRLPPPQTLGWLFWHRHIIVAPRSRYQQLGSAIRSEQHPRPAISLLHLSGRIHGSCTAGSGPPEACWDGGDSAAGQHCCRFCLRSVWARLRVPTPWRGHPAHSYAGCRMQRTDKTRVPATRRCGRDGSNTAAQHPWREDQADREHHSPPVVSSCHARADMIASAPAPVDGATGYGVDSGMPCLLIRRSVSRNLVIVVGNRTPRNSGTTRISWQHGDPRPRSRSATFVLADEKDDRG